VGRNFCHHLDGVAGAFDPFTRLVSATVLMGAGWALQIFVDTEADVRLIRRIQRDVKERGRTLESIIGQYVATVR
jgi:hypothetical protein